jgi:hypothetical protein
MKRFLFALAALGLAIASTPSFAVVTPTPGQILARCPDNPDAQDCPAAAEDFLVPRPKSPQSDAQIVNLVLKIATEASDEKVPLKVCLNAADGLRVLAGGVEDPGTAQQIMDIADALCDNIRTAAIGDEEEAGQGGGNGPAGVLDFGSTSGPSGAGGNSGENGGGGGGTGGGGGNPNGPPTSCPTGQLLEGSVCVNDTLNCPSGQHLEGNTCVPDTQSCPTGQHLEGNTCVPDTTPDPEKEKCDNGGGNGDDGCTPGNAPQNPNETTTTPTVPTNKGQCQQAGGTWTGTGNSGSCTL